MCGGRCCKQFRKYIKKVKYRFGFLNKLIRFAKINNLNYCRKLLRNALLPLVTLVYTYTGKLTCLKCIYVRMSAEEGRRIFINDTDN